MNELRTKHARPLSPDLSIYRWRAPMLASIAHRASGMALVLFVPLYLWLLHGMTSSPDHYVATLDWLHSSLGKCSLWLVGVALVYHFSNGIRFLCIDAGWGESREMMRFSALLVLLIALFSALLFVWLLFL